MSFGCDSYSLEREEAEDLIKRHGGRVTGSVSKKTVIYRLIIFITLLDPYIYLVLIVSLYLQSYLLADEDIGGRKSSKAKELGYVTIDLFSCHFFKTFYHIPLNPYF